MLVKNIWKYHIALWSIVILLSLLTDYGLEGYDALLYNFSLRGLRYEIVFYTTSIIIYFINFKYVCPRFLSKKRSLFFTLAIIFLVFLFAFIRYFLDEVLLKQIIGTHNYYGKFLEFQYYFFDNFYYALKPILYSTIIFLVFRFINAQNEILQLQLNHKKAELNFLKSQISPHFLFNTLNTFYSELINKQPETAKDIHKLSELLRYVTYETNQDFIELRKEIRFIEDYIYFFKKRFENELFVTFKVTGLIRNQKIASLVLMHFIENVFKHGVLNDKNYKADIEIQVFDTDLIITTKNKFDSSVKYMDSGIGVENLKKRLLSIYENTFELKQSNKNSYFYTYLKIPV